MFAIINVNIKKIYSKTLMKKLQINILINPPNPLKINPIIIGTANESAKNTNATYQDTNKNTSITQA
jgi:hypothetical protein